jgi:hypothetical protein
VFYAGLEIASAFVRSTVWKLGNGAAYFRSVIFAIKFPNIYFSHLVAGVPVIEQPLVTGYWPTPFRLSAILPAAALGTPIRWGKAWRVTKGHTWSFIAVALVVVVGAGGLEVFVAPMFAKNLFLISLWKIVYGWVDLMVNVSILATIYGHDVEKRPLI